jgi:lipopolysaccharide exporter
MRANQTLDSRVRRGALWNVANTVMLRLGSVAITAIVVRIVTPREFGVFAVAVTVQAVVASIGDGCVATSLTRGSVDIKRNAPTVASIALATGVVLSTGMALFARPLATSLGSSDATDVMRVLAIAVLLVGVFAVPNAELARDFRQSTLFRINVVAFVPGNILLVTLAALGYGAMAFAWSRVLIQLLTGIGMTLSVGHFYRPGWCRSCVGPLLRFGLPLTGANLLNYAWLNTDYAFIGRWLGPVQLGVYMLAFNIAYWPVALLGPMLNNVAMPGWSRVSNDPGQLSRVLATSLRMVALVVFPVSALSCALAGPLVLVVYGGTWARAALPLSVLAVYAATFTVSLVFSNMLVAMGRTGVVLGIQLVWATCLVPAMYLGVEAYGVVGAAIAHVLVVVALMLPMYLYVLHRQRCINLRQLLHSLALPIAASALAALAASAVARVVPIPIGQLLIGGAVGCLVYVSLARRALAVVLPMHRFSLVKMIAAAKTRARVRADPGAHDRDQHYGIEARDESSPIRASSVANLGRQLSANHPEPMASHGGPTYAYPQAGWRAQAVALHERTLADQERQLGPDHPHTLASRTNLAYAYCQSGSLARAIPLYERTFADWTRLLGSDHPRTLRTSNYLAACYREAGRLADAIPLYERTLADRRRLLGPDHPSTLRTSNYLAACYREAGRLADAIPLYEQALVGWHRLLGPDHPRTLRTSNYLASTYSDAGRLPEAIRLYEQALAHCARVLGSDHTLTRTVRRNLNMTRGLTAGWSHHPWSTSFPRSPTRSSASPARPAPSAASVAGPGLGRIRNAPAGNHVSD